MGRSRRKWESPRPQVGVGARRGCDIFFAASTKIERLTKSGGSDWRGLVGLGLGEENGELSFELSKVGKGVFSRCGVAEPGTTGTRGPIHKSSSEGVGGGEREKKKKKGWEEVG